MSLSRLLACPRCLGPLRQEAEALACPADGLTFARRAGICDLIDPARRKVLYPFTSHYAAVRRAEGWGSADPAYYAALPFQDLTGRFPDLWRIRARSFRCLRQLLGGLQRPDGGPPRVLDLGAGNGWLSYRLKEMGFAVCAVDLSADEADGLGAATHYLLPFLCVLAEFERLPFPDGTFDTAVFNASLHYAPDASAALCSAARVLRPGGHIFVADSPIYRSAQSGDEMMREMRDRLTREFRIETWEQPGPGYLTFDQIRNWPPELGIQVRLHRPRYGLRWRMRPLLAKMRRSRESATFRIIELTKQG
ncbi:MAG: hypothetical protein A3F84_12680 [Candidatus Handelsmanbacteria bacterium RIFCSPLOWO2_12_FULL_64_10]|uniref:Methyltransferase type 11 domain-containing protein n=1 Tax=Handelsmanbacteria sp. (strain RIFCSPLOWO2_12_FULL_64_10) TaxID=1817868 RepID=A0A1F6CWF1_HANXR|nr:MAG: hypothetical protein A3F84_12680 [Candidatus Handelsmanbacteria bacterium RIFCSPLOWO2_12_FULL_64_10]